MPRRLKTARPCSVCGTLTTKGVRPGRPRYCFECGIAKSAQNARLMHDKTGDPWLTWQASNATGAHGPGSPNPKG